MSEGTRFNSVLDTQTPPLKTAQGVNDLSRLALARGGEIASPLEVEWDLARNCTQPKVVQHHGKPSYNALGKMVAVSRYITMHVQCRQCPNCLKRRAWHWAMRASAEIGGAKRTWFATLTLTPAQQFMSLTEARQRARNRAVTWEDLPHAEQFRYICSAIGPEITRWLKRVRKYSGARLRYCLVAEPHKSGSPHFHALIHEMSETPVTERVLRLQWKYGFSKFKLVDEGDNKAARYVSKYLAKSAQARVRASARYGDSFFEEKTVTNDLNHRIKI